MKRFYQKRVGLLGLVTALCAAPRASRAEDPELNPYECLGRYEAATGNRTIGQIRQETEKRLKDLDNPNEPKSVNAMKHCVVAMLMSRTGNGDATKHYELSVQNAPEEPGYELWWGSYYSLYRGARGPVLETAEQHYYASLRKLEALRHAGKYRPHHAVVEEWTKKRLISMYQQDGVHLIPGKQYPQQPAGLYRPGLSLSAIASISKDTRDFNRKGDWNEMRVFSTERDFAASDIRAGGFARAVFEEVSGQVLSVPETSIRYDADGASVVTVGADNRVKRVPIQTGQRGNGLVELVKGPPAGAWVVQNAAAFLLDGDLVRPIRTTLKAPVAKAAASAGPARR